mgnify:CR=1 FL=1
MSAWKEEVTISTLRRRQMRVRYEMSMPKAVPAVPSWEVVGVAGHTDRWSHRRGRIMRINMVDLGRWLANNNQDWKNHSSARFVCCLTLFWPSGKSYSTNGKVNGKISSIKKGKNGFGYDPIFIPNGYNKTFSEMKPKLKMSIDHRFIAYRQIMKFLN